MIERYRDWYEHECDCNNKMLGMIESVPELNCSEPKFQRALVLAAHLSACRENWLDRMVSGGTNQADWWPEDARLEDLRPRYDKMQSAWTSYLADLNDEQLVEDFEFDAGGGRYRWSIEGQIVQLVGHAFYHRGQIAQIVAELGGTPVDTDYLYWAYDRNPRWGKIS
jgi:uncharacterized damage-inducible protein DinB